MKKHVTSSAGLCEDPDNCKFVSQTSRSLSYSLLCRDIHLSHKLWFIKFSRKLVFEKLRDRHLARLQFHKLRKNKLSLAVWQCVRLFVFQFNMASIFFLRGGAVM